MQLFKDVIVFSIVKSDEELVKHKEQTISEIEAYLNELILNDSFNDKKKADLLCYWLSDYIRFISRENEFSPKKMKKYKRGDIIKVHLGFRIGSEEGGLHYAVVMDTDNALSAPTLTVVPLTSVKKGKDI